MVLAGQRSLTDSCQLSRLVQIGEMGTGAVPVPLMFLIWGDPGHFLSPSWTLWLHLINSLSHFWLSGSI